MSCRVSFIKKQNQAVSEGRQRTVLVWALAECDKVDDTVLHLQHGGALAVQDRDAVGAPGLVRR